MATTFPDTIDAEIWTPHLPDNGTWQVVRNEVRPAENITGTARDIEQALSIMRQELGVYENPLYPSIWGKQFEQVAREQFRLLMQTYPRAVPRLKQAIVHGQIYGKTYGFTSDTTFSGYGCILGWIAHLEQISVLTVWCGGHFRAVEQLVSDVVPGDTPVTNSALAIVMEELLQFEQQQASLYENVYALTTDVLQRYPEVAPAYIRAAEEGLFDGYEFEPAENGVACIIGWILEVRGENALPDISAWDCAVDAIRTYAPADQLERVFMAYNSTAIRGKTYRTSPILRAVWQASHDVVRETSRSAQKELVLV